VNTCNRTITNTRLVSILLRLHAVSSRLLLNIWHSNDREPKVHFFLLEAKSHLSPVSCPWWSPWPTPSIHHIPPTVTCVQSLWPIFFLRKALPLSQQAWPWRWRVNNKFGQNRVSLKVIYVWGVNSTVVNHSDYFVWKDTSYYVARRCDDTFDWKRVNSCVLITPLLQGVEEPKQWPKNPGNTPSNALLMSRFQTFAVDREVLHAVFYFFLSFSSFEDPT